MYVCIRFQHPTYTANNLYAIVLQDEYAYQQCRGFYYGVLQRRTPTHVYLPAQEYTPSSFYPTLWNGSSNHRRFGKTSFKVQLTHKYLIILAGTTSYCIFFIQHPSQPKCYEVVLYTDDVQLLNFLCTYYKLD